MNEKYRSSSFTLLLLLLPHGGPGPRNQFLSCRPITLLHHPRTSFKDQSLHEEEEEEEEEKGRASIFLIHNLQLITLSIFIVWIP